MRLIQGPHGCSVDECESPNETIVKVRVEAGLGTGSTTVCPDHVGVGARLLLAEIVEAHRDAADSLTPSRTV